MQSGRDRGAAIIENSDVLPVYHNCPSTHSLNHDSTHLSHSIPIHDASQVLSFRKHPRCDLPGGPGQGRVRYVHRYHDPWGRRIHTSCSEYTVNDAPTFVELTGCDHLPTIVYIPTATVIDESASCAGIALGPSTVVHEPPLRELGGLDPTGDSVPFT